MRPFSAARHALLLAPLVAMSLSACGDAADDGEQATPTRGTPIRVTFGDTVITGRLRDASTAGNLAGQLPLTLASRDHNNAEKTAPLPRELTVEDAPARHDPAARGHRLLGARCRLRPLLRRRRAVLRRQAWVPRESLLGEQECAYGHRSER